MRRGSWAKCLDRRGRDSAVHLHGRRAVLDQGSFASCTSPKTYKLKKGFHHFEVRAVSADGTDATPAESDFKVKKKKK